MRSIDYNISTTKIVNLKKSAIPVFLSITLSIVMLYIGIGNILRTNIRLSDKITESTFFKTESDKLMNIRSETEQKIEVIRKVWNSRVKFVNGLIHKKLKNYLEILDFIENVLPESVSVTGLEMNNSSSNLVNLSIISYSTEKLYDLYKNLLDYNLDIGNEIESQGRYKAKLRIKYTNGKK